MTKKPTNNVIISSVTIVTIFFHFERTPVRLFHLFESAANSNPKSISRQENIHCNQTRKKKIALTSIHREKSRLSDAVET